MKKYTTKNNPAVIEYYIEEYAEGDDVYIDLIIVPEEHRRKGYGYNILSNFITKMKSKNKYLGINLLVSSCEGTDINVLISLYKSLGFRVLDDSKLDFIPMEILF